MFKSLIPYLILVMAIVIVAVLILKRNSQAKTQIQIGEKVTLLVDIADTVAERKQGYSNHAPIGYQEGLLFTFDRPDTYPFWMNEMRFDLDFIMFRDNRVVELAQNIPAPQNNQGNIEYVISRNQFDKLLEVKSGFIKKYGLKLGDRLNFPN